MASSIKDNRKQFSYGKKFYQEAKESEERAEWDFPVTDELVSDVASKIGYDFEKYSREQLKLGLEQEKEHGSWYGEDVNITKNNPVIAGKIAFAHIKEIRNYYTYLNAMEERAKEENNNEEGGEENGEHSEY